VRRAWGRALLPAPIKIRRSAFHNSTIGEQSDDHKQSKQQRYAQQYSHFFHLIPPLSFLFFKILDIILDISHANRPPPFLFQIFK
jgi:hypothetical protein